MYEQVWVDTDIDHDAMEWVFKELVNLQARIREQFLSEHFIKTVSGAFHETWNIFALVSKFHYVCFLSIKRIYREKMILNREKMIFDSQTLIALDFDK